MLKFKYNVSVYITANTHIERLEWRGKIAHFLASELGGFTYTEGTGGWVNKSGGLVEEPVYIVNGWAQNKDAFLNLAILVSDYHRTCKQEAVSIVINGKPYICFSPEDITNVFAQA